MLFLALEGCFLNSVCLSYFKKSVERSWAGILKWLEVYKNMFYQEGLTCICWERKTVEQQKSSKMWKATTERKGIIYFFIFFPLLGRWTSNRMFKLQWRGFWLDNREGKQAFNEKIKFCSGLFILVLSTLTVRNSITLPPPPKKNKIEMIRYTWSYFGAVRDEKGGNV